jgi:predicted membrane protein
MQLKATTILGGLLLIWGVNIALGTLLPIHLPLFSLAFAAGLIYLGYRVVTGQSLLSGRQTNALPARKHHVIFSRERIDLRAYESSSVDPLIHVDCIFGETTIAIDPNRPLTIRLNAVFGEARTPDDNLVVFGTLNYTSTRNDTASRVFVEANVAFGSVKVVTD